MTIHPNPWHNNLLLICCDCKVSTRVNNLEIMCDQLQVGIMDVFLFFRFCPHGMNAAKIMTLTAFPSRMSAARIGWCCSPLIVAILWRTPPATTMSHTLPVVTLSLRWHRNWAWSCQLDSSLAVGPAQGQGKVSTESLADGASVIKQVATKLSCKHLKIQF